MKQLYYIYLDDNNGVDIQDKPYTDGPTIKQDVNGVFWFMDEFDEAHIMHVTTLSEAIKEFEELIR